MAANLCVSIVQKQISWENKSANLAQYERLLTSVQDGTDLIVLPEMFSTGFTMNAASMAEPQNGPTLKWMESISKEKNAVVTGSYIVEEEGRYFNRLVWMSPDGHYKTYDKKHLFTYAKEDLYYKAGQQHLIAELKGWKIMPLICYDLRFPVWSRNVFGYDILLYVANFPEKRRFAWQQLLIARAIENQAYTIGVNCVGKDGNDISYSGDSLILDYEGNTLVHLAYSETIHTLTLNYDNLQAFRARFAFLKDQDIFSIHN